MANDNKNAQELAPDLEDTSELELLSSSYSDPALDFEAESDAATHSFESPDLARERKSVDTLQVELRERDDYIGRLEYELEQLRARASGIETELKARAALTEGISAELAETRQALADARVRLEERDQAARKEAGAHDEIVALQLAEIDSLATQLAEVTCEYEKEREERQALEAQCNALEDRIQRLASAMAELEAAAESSRPQHRENERLAGELLGYRGEIRGLREQAAKTEAYADTLRRRVQEQAAELGALAASSRSTEAALADALANVAALREQAEAGSRDAAAVREDERAARERLERELDDARAELARAREAAAQAEASNDQLAPQLVEATGSRLALESQLSQSGETRKQEIEALERQVRRLEQELEDAESKVANKDAAISVLLAELANKPQAAASEVQADAPPPRQSERRAPAADDRHGPEKERTTRLLVGTLDGQEVRFPLFKNKLTIGRTAHNDIQLKQQFISRRHAVVVCDHDSTRIVDWGSKNGIFVNGVRVSEKVLKTGDRLTVGTAEFRFEERPKR